MSAQAGDWISDNYQYEFRNFMFGSGTIYIVRSVQGLLGRSDISGKDTDLVHEHGATPGPLTYRKRVINIDLVIDSPVAEIEDHLEIIQKAFQLPRRRQFTSLDRFVFRRGDMAKYVTARVDKLDITSDYELAKGLGRVSIQLVAPDPVKYGLLLNTQDIIIATGQTQNTGQIWNLGDFADGAVPVITIGGPATDVRITNVDDDNRGFRWDGIITAGQSLEVDFQNRTVKLDGVDAYSGVRSDNQWWELPSGGNTIVYDRAGSNVGASSTATVAWRHTWS